MPAIILTGISPSGLNASSDGEIRIFYDWVAAQQEAFWREPLETILKCVQLSLFGEIDPDISFTFVPLYQMTPAEESEIRAKDGVTDCAYVAAGIIDPSEVRDRLAKDPNSGYQGLDTDAVIVPPTPPVDEQDPGAAQDGWITVKPNGPDAKGQPVFIGEGGVVEKGMGGKFNGQKISEIHKNFSGPKSPVDKGVKTVNNLSTETKQEFEMTSPKEITSGTQKQIDFANKKRPSALRQAAKIDAAIPEINGLIESEPLSVEQKDAAKVYVKALESLSDMAKSDDAAQVLDAHRITENPYQLGGHLYFKSGATQKITRDLADTIAELVLQQ
jgi:hypothetical protein